VIWVQLFSCAGATAQKIIKRGDKLLYSGKTGKTFKWGFLFFFSGGFEKIIGINKYRGNYPYF